MFWSLGQGEGTLTFWGSKARLRDGRSIARQIDSHTFLKPTMLTTFKWSAITLRGIRLFFAFPGWRKEVCFWGLQGLGMGDQKPSNSIQSSLACNNHILTSGVCVCVMLFFGAVNAPSLSLGTWKNLASLPSAQGTKKWKFDIPHRIVTSHQKWRCWLKKCDYRSIFCSCECPSLSLGTWKSSLPFLSSARGPKK